MRQLQCLREELLNRDNHDPIREHNFEAAIGIVNRHEASLARYRAGASMLLVVFLYFEGFTMLLFYSQDCKCLTGSVVGK